MKLSLRNTVMIKLIDRELIAILDSDIKKMKEAKQRERNLEFVRRIAA